MRFFIVFTLLFLSFAAWGKTEIITEQVKVSLISSQSSFVKNSQFHIGLRFELKPEWHVYWKNPGDSGAAPKWAWTVENGQAELVGWPVPERLPVEHLINFGYSQEVVFPFLVKTDGKGNVSAKVDLEWLVCKVECIPGFGVLELKLPETESANLDLAAAEKINSFIRRIPVSSESKIRSREIQNDEQLLFLPLAQDIKELHFFPETSRFYLTQNPRVEKQDTGYLLTVGLNINRAGDPLGESAVIKTVLPDGTTQYQSYEIVPEGPPQSLVWILLLALVGGAILNLMPCVFPVLSIKVLSFMGKDKDHRALRVSGWLYSFGVVLSFAALAVILLLLRMAGEQLGWGFQLQSPWFVGFLIVLFILIGLNLVGVFEVGNVLTRMGVKVSEEKFPRLSAFLSGVLATVVATPCTAPFMGTAIGFTLTQSYYVSLLVFVFLGLGMAIPFLLLCYFPNRLLKLLRPGQWMETLKKALSLPIFLTAAWLGWVLYQQVGAQAGGEFSKNWKNFDKAGIQQSLQAKESVFVDFTAAWCITCQVNKKAVLETEEIQTLFADNAVILYRADWTSYDPVITKELESHGRNSLPLYVYYHKGSKEPVILPEILTKQMIRDLFNKEQ